MAGGFYTNFCPKRALEGAPVGLPCAWEGDEAIA